MNHSINFSGFLELLEDLPDEFEPYGLSDVSDMADKRMEGTAQTKTWGRREDVPGD